MFIDRTDDVSLAVKHSSSNRTAVLPTSLSTVSNI